MLRLTFYAQCLILSCFLTISACKSIGNRQTQSEQSQTASISGSEDLRNALEQTKNSIRCDERYCGMGVKRIGTNSQAFLNADVPLYSWSVVKLYMVAAYVQRALELDPNLNFEQMENRKTPCGNRLIDDIYFSLVESYNPNPSCILQDMIDRDPHNDNALAYLTSFLDLSRFSQVPPKHLGNKIIGFDLVCWAPAEGGPKHYLYSSQCPGNRLSPWAATEMLNRLWTAPEFEKTKIKMTEYLRERNNRLSKSSNVFNDWPVLHKVLRKSGAVPVDNNNSMFNYSDIGIMDKDGCLFAYSYFNEEPTPYAEGVRNRFLFLKSLHENLRCQ